MKNTWLDYRNEWLTLITQSVAFLKKTDDQSIHHKNAKRALNRLLRAWTDYPPTYVSEKAMLLFKAKKINPSTTTRKDSRAFNSKGDNKKPLIVFEHTIPINEFIKILVSIESVAIERALLNYPGVCWITREEDNDLNQNKFRNNRNGDWTNAYREVGINVIKL